MSEHIDLNSNGMVMRPSEKLDIEVTRILDNSKDRINEAIDKSVANEIDNIIKNIRHEEIQKDIDHHMVALLEKNIDWTELKKLLGATVEIKLINELILEKLDEEINNRLDDIILKKLNSHINDIILEKLKIYINIINNDFKRNNRKQSRCCSIL